MKSNKGYCIERGLYRVVVRINGNRQFIARYKTEQEAQAAHSIAKGDQQSSPHITDKQLKAILEKMSEAILKPIKPKKATLINLTNQLEKLIEEVSKLKILIQNKQ